MDLHTTITMISNYSNHHIDHHVILYHICSTIPQDVMYLYWDSIDNNDIIINNNTSNIIIDSCCRSCQ